MRIKIDKIPETAEYLGNDAKDNINISGGTRRDYYYDPATETYYVKEFDGSLPWKHYIAGDSDIATVKEDFAADLIRITDAYNDRDTTIETDDTSGDELVQEFNLTNDSAYLQLAQATRKDGKDRTIVPIPKGNHDGDAGTSLRYPNSDYFEKDSDYMMFEFGKYIPPFLPENVQDRLGSGTAGRNEDISSRYIGYNQSATNFKPITDSKRYRPVILYMPQDISTEVKTSWNAKAFSSMGRGLVAAANGDFSKLGDYNVPNGLKSTFASLFTQGINSIPGVAGNLSLNDVTGSTRGVILNPNVEVLFDQPDLREFGLKFKMTPHNAEEAKIIRSICRTFQRASLPGFGDENAGSWLDKDGGNDAKGSDKVSIGGGNMITVPHMCRVSFMKGSGLHPYLTQYKTCAITRVQVNYTPDGNYATYADGAPVATEISLDFLETKLIFDQEISNNSSSL
tara:strand:+ start:6989 stop:8350 length:1362 start_codon:yes stop_codon:yes gene_type:complete